MYAKDDSGSALVLVLGIPADPVADEVAAHLRGLFEIESADVESVAELREVVERHRDRLGALIVGASDGAAASMLVWDLDHGTPWLRDRTLVVVDTRATLDAVPVRLRSTLPYRAISEGALDDLAELVALLLDHPHEIDVLASLVRSAVDRRSVDAIPPLLGDWTSADTLAPERLVLAHVGDGGRSPNSLWAHWTREREGPAIERLGARLVAHVRWLARANSSAWRELGELEAAKPTVEPSKPSKSVMPVMQLIESISKKPPGPKR